MLDHRSDGSKRMAAEDMLERLGRYDEDPSLFLANLLMAKCFMGGVNAGAILCGNREGNIDVLAVYPQLGKGDTAPGWLKESAALARKHAKELSVTEPLKHLLDNGSTYIVMIPLHMAEVNNAVAVYLIETDDKAVLEEKSQKLQLITGVLNYSEARFARVVSQERTRRLQQAMEVLSAFNQHDAFTSAAMTLCNEVASQWQCERVSLGLLEGRYVQIKTMSHTEDFSRKMKIIQDIESAMEECLDQDIEVVSPAAEGSVNISREADELAQNHGLHTVLSLPLRRGGDVIGVLTLERPADKVFSADEVETIRLSCELCTARLKNLYENNRWIGATIGLKMRDSLAKILGPKHTWAKVATIIICAALLFVVFAKGEFRARASFVLEAMEQQIVPAPFDGYIKSVEVEVGDKVEAYKSVLGTIDTAELRLQLASVKAEKSGYLKRASAAMRDNETAQVQIAQANADKAQAQIDLLSYRIEQANLVSPISGIVIRGELKRKVGAPVNTGDVLFEVCPLESLRAQLLVPEDLIFYINAGQKGKLATASYPGQRIQFVVERINPIAEVINQRNVFKVRVQLSKRYSWMRPGMEGVAKVSVGRRRYIWIWTRKITNWVRLKLWI